ncbi:AATC protein, partial [Polypterus senegalus]|nr:AATC protein [Polypterus senegalus]
MHRVECGRVSFNWRNCGLRGYTKPAVTTKGCILTGNQRQFVFEVNDLLEHQLFIKTICLDAAAKDELHVVEVQSMITGKSTPIPIASLKPLVMPMICLDAAAKDELHVVEVQSMITGKSTPIPIASLKPLVMPMVSLYGLEVNLPVTFNLRSGGGPVYIYGQHIIKYLGEDGECFVHPVIRKVILQVTGGVQTLGGIGAVRVGAELLKHWYNEGGSRPWVVYVPAQCDEAVVSTLQETKIKDIHSYPYWDPEKRCLALEEMLHFLESVPEQSIIVLYTSAHCPTGADPTLDQWKQIADVMMRHRLFPFFLLPSQGLCSGDPNEDAASLRYFVSVGFELICAQSFSQNFGLYNERVGNLILVLKDSPTFLSVQSQAEKVVQTLWFRPPCWGARLVTIILNNPALVVEWKEGLRAIAERTMLMREMLKEKLRMLSIPGSWDHLSQQSGLYCCTGLRDDEVEFLVRKQHVYLPSSGNINISTLNHQIVDYVAETIYLAVTKEDPFHKPSTIHL